MSVPTRLGWHHGVRILSACLLAALLPPRADAALSSSTLQGDGSLVLELDFPQLELRQERVDGVLLDVLEMPDAAWVGQPGAPDLPAVHQIIHIPDRSDVQLTVLDVDAEPLHGLRPMPNQERLHTEAELPQPWLQDEDVYLRNAEFPGRLAELDSPVLMRDQRLVKASFFPVQVNPVTGEGRWIRHMTVRVSFEGENLVNAGSGPLADPTPSLAGMTADVLDASGRPEALREALLNPGERPGHYLVFAPAAALTQVGLQDLIEWKRRKGHTVTVVSGADMTFTSTAIRNRIVTEYQGVDPVDFVLLVGDTDGTYALPTDGTGYDHYYACVAGNDILGDVGVGRLSVENANQLNSVCYKIINYESAPFMEDEGAWMQHAGLTVGSSHCALSMKILSRNIAAEMVEHYGYNDIDTNFCVGAGALPTWFDSGLSFYNYRGWIGMDGLDQNTVLNLDQGPRTPVATIFTCSTGDFSSEDDYTENFLRAGSVATPGGAVAAMGFATASTHTRYNNVVVGGYYHGLLELDLPQVGACLLQGKYELFRTLPTGDGQITNFSNWGNLMGDPGLMQWVGLPPALDVQGLPDTLPLGQNHLDLLVTSGGDPLADAVVCAYQVNDQATITLQQVVMTDAAGHAMVPLEGMQAGDLQITVTRRRHLPVLHTATVGSSTLDVAAAATSGDVLPGQAAQAVSLNLSNPGSADLSNLSIQFSLDPSLGTLAAPPQTVALLGAGADQALGAIQISPASHLSDGDQIPVGLEISADQGTFSRVVWLDAAAPVPSLVGTTTPNGALMPGVTRTLRLQLRNVGSVAASDLLVELESDNAYYGQVASPPQAAGDVAVGSTVNVDFSILINTQTMIGYQLPLHMTWSTANGATGESELLATVGTPGTGDPTGPDGYGYWAFESTDTNYDMAPDFAWIPVAPSEGGQGTELPLTDNGDEQDDALSVQLPFPFTYYGQTYTEAMICSNGFISFQDYGFGEVDFRNHWMPSGMGPDAMIAPMWDDHLTSGAAGVWTWFDSANHRFVITWLNVPSNQTGGPNTFQLVLFDPLYHPTMTGDGPFLFQYQDFNDTQTASTDFPNCTIGIKDHSSTHGMTLRNAASNVATVAGIQDGKAVFFTTSAASSLTPPEVSLDSEEFSVELQSGDIGSDSLLIRNNGQLPLLWSASLVEAGARDAGGPDGFGYIWADNTEEGGPVYNWLEPEGRQNLTFANHDQLSAALPLDYIQWLYGEPLNILHVSPNGCIVFSGIDPGSANVELPSAEAPSYMVAAWWDDLKPNANDPDQVWWWTNHVDSLVVAWDNVQHFNPFIYGGPVRAQLILRANGEVTFQVGAVGGGAYPVNQGGTVGVQGAPGTQGFTFVHNQDISARLPWALRMSPPEWVIPASAMSGRVEGGDSTWVRLQFTTMPGFPLPNGTYQSNLLLTTNDLNHMQTQLDVSMEVWGATGVDPVRPERTALTGAWPNPFNPTTRLAFTLAQAGPARLSVHNLLGQEVAVLVDGDLSAGGHQVDWNAAKLGSGLYVAVLEADGKRDERKLMLVK